MGKRFMEILFRSRRVKILIIVADVSIIFLALVLLIDSYDDYNEMLVFVSILLGFFASLILVHFYITIIRSFRYEDEEKEKEAYLDRFIESKNISAANNNEINALARMRANLGDIREFYIWSQKQAKMSFVLAVLMCIAGFLLLVAAVVLLVVFNKNMQTSIVSTIGGVATELVAGTSLSVYRNSLKQMNYYHKALHEDERFLSSINLLSEFSNVKEHDRMLREIIKSEIRMNILEYTNEKKEN